MLLSGKAAKLATVVAVALHSATVRLAGSGKVVPDVQTSRLTHVDDAGPGEVRTARENADRGRRRLAARHATVAAAPARESADRARRRLAARHAAVAAAAAARVFQISEEVRPRPSQLPRPLLRALGQRSALTRPTPLTPGSPRGRARFVA